MHVLILRARKSQKITQLEMAKQLGISRQTYVDIENGVRVPRVDLLNKISEITNKPVSYFFERNNPMDCERLLGLLAELEPKRRDWYMKLFEKILEEELDFIS
ncbi:TPA: helix-turn-helix transcriptional regulator [Photobacterium damselae]